MKRKTALPALRRTVAASLVAMAVALSGRTSPGLAGPLDLPEIGSTADAVMTSGGERRLGKAFMRKVREALPVSDDPLFTDYLESLGKELVAADRSAGGQFNFFLINLPVVNAFAGPGGYIGVFSGLILASESEDELAAVMAHEIAHVTQRHLMRGLEEQGRISLPATALLVAAAILGAQVSSDAGAAAIAGKKRERKEWRTKKKKKKKRKEIQVNKKVNKRE